MSMFQNPHEDTEWNDALRKHGILPKKEKEVVDLEEPDLSEPGKCAMCIVLHVCKQNDLRN